MKGIVLLLFMLASTYSFSMPTDTVIVEKAGGLSAALSSIDKDKITSLAISGKLTAADIIVLRAAEGKLTALDTLDISNVTFVPSDEPYFTYSTANDGSFSPNIFRFFISEEVRDTAYLGKSLSQANPHYYDHYDPYLSGAFSGMSYKRIIMPHDMNVVGKRTFWKCEKLEEVVMNTEPTNIGEWAFRDCIKLVSIPNLSKVENMGELAFGYCYKLKGTLNLSSLRTIPDDAFTRCEKIERVQISKDATSIGGYAFSGCKSLTYVNIPQSLSRLSWTSFRETPWLSNHTDKEGGITYLGNVAIEAEQALTTLKFREGTLGIADDFVHSGRKQVTSLQLPSTICYIGKGAFSEGAFTTIILPERLEEIGYRAFRKSGLKSVVFPTSLKIIGEQAFSESQIEEVTLEETVEDVGGWAFYNTKSLKKISFDAKGTLGRNIFQDCDNLKEASIGHNVKTIPIRMFWSCDKLEKINFGLNITSIEQSAFEDCYSLREIDLPNSLLAIGICAFADCDSLREVILPEGLLRVDAGVRGDGAFYHCDSLRKIVLPSTLQEIGNEAFRSDNIQEVISHIKSPFPIGYYDFGTRFPSQGTLYVPAGTKELYLQTDDWKKFKNIVEEGESNGINDVRSNQSTPPVTYRINGIKTTNKRGLNIIRYSDGSVRKVNTK